MISENLGAELQWLALNIRENHIQVRTVSLWHVQTHDVVVGDREVVGSSATCMKAPLEFGNACTVQLFEAGDFAVPGLFAKARTLVDEKWASVTFDPDYFFPNGLGVDDPEIYYEEWNWSVLAFEVGR